MFIGAIGTLTYSYKNSIKWDEVSHVLYACTPMAFIAGASINIFSEVLLKTLLYVLMFLSSLFSLKSFYFGNLGEFGVEGGHLNDTRDMEPLSILNSPNPNVLSKTLELLTLTPSEKKNKGSNVVDEHTGMNTSESDCSTDTSEVSDGEVDIDIENNRDDDDIASKATTIDKDGKVATQKRPTSPNVEKQQQQRRRSNSSERKTRSRTLSYEHPRLELSKRLKLWFLGCTSGILSPLTGTSGAVIFLPLSLTFNYPILHGIGCAQVIQLPISIASTISFATTSTSSNGLDYKLGLAIACGGVPSVIVGGYFAHRIEERKLRGIVTIFVCVVSLLLIFKEIWSDAGAKALIL